MKKHKIIYLVSTLKKSGPTNQLFNIINNLDKNFFEAMVITLSKEPQESLKPFFENNGIKVQSLKLSRFEGFFSAHKHLKKIFDDFMPDLIHTQGIRADNIIFKYFKNYPHILTIRNYPFYDYPPLYGIIKGTFMAYNHCNIVKKSPNSVACSKSIARIFKEKQNTGIKFIQNGVDLNIFKPSSIEEKINLRKKLELPLDKKIFILTGHLIKRKNNKTVLSAINKINKDSVFIFLGDGDEKAELCALANEKILFLGRKPNISEYLQASDVFISASLAEGLPNAVMEAMACGLPCLLSDIPPHQEILEYNKEVGEIFPCFDSAILSYLIEKFSEIDLFSKTQAARQIITEHLNSVNMSGKYQELYKRILNNEI